MASKYDGMTHCTLGALQVVETDDTNTITHVGTVRARRELEDRLGDGVPGWNDDPTRTVDEVREMLLSTAKDLRNSVSEE